MRLILIYVGATAPWSIAAAQAPIEPAVVSPQPADSAQLVRRIATTARLAAEEYRLGVKDGQVVLAAEVEEARLFLMEAAKAAAVLPTGYDSTASRELQRVLGLVEGTAPADSVQLAVERLVVLLSTALGVSLDEVPDFSPSLSRGEAIYQEQCAACHGRAGEGAGPAALGLVPAPSKLADPVFFHESTPLDFYRRITIGVAGTAMASYEGPLSLEDRWAVALYSSTLRLPAARGSARADLADFRRSAALSDRDLLDSLGTSQLARVAAVRMASAGGRRRDYSSVFGMVRSRVDSALAFAAAGRRDEARSSAIDAYMAFERVERELRIKDPALVRRAEKAFADLREVPASSQLATAREELTRSLDRAQRTLGTSLTPVSLFLQSFLILIREGLEAILVIGALIAFLAKMGAGDRKRDIHLGVAAAVGLSLVTALVIETVFRLAPSHQEAFEGVTLVVATIMLFSVSYWLLSKMEVSRWNQFVKSRLSEALGKRSMLALASVAFLAVYREGFETVLFYKALAVSGGTAATTGPILAGFLVAAAGLGVVYVAINRFGVRLPLRPFFAATSGFLYLMALSFAGTAVAELQEGGFLPITAIPGMFRAPTLGIYPTLQSLSVQALLISLAAGALVWTFVIAPRRHPVAAVVGGAEPSRRRPRSRRRITST